MVVDPFQRAAREVELPALKMLEAGRRVKPKPRNLSLTNSTLTSGRQFPWLGHAGRTVAAITRAGGSSAARCSAELGDDRLDAYPPLHEARTEDGWSVRLDAPNGPVTVGLVERIVGPLPSTCAASQALPVRQRQARVRSVSG